MLPHICVRKVVNVFDFGASFLKKILRGRKNISFCRIEVVWPLKVLTYISPMKWAIPAVAWAHFTGAFYEGYDSSVVPPCTERL